MESMNTTHLSLTLFLVLLLLPTTLPGVALASPAVEPEYVQTRLLPETQTVRPGDHLTIMIEQTIRNGWHTYWKNPGDSGEALSVTWALPKGVSVDPLEWPVPHQMPTGPLLNFGYGGTVRYLAEIEIPADYSGREIVVGADLAWLACKEICIPEAKKLELAVPVDTAPPLPSNQAAFAAAREAMPRSVAWPGRVEETDGTLLLSFTPDPEELAPLQGIDQISFFPEDWGLIRYAEAQDNRIENGEITLRLARDSRALSEVGQIRGVITYVTPAGEYAGVAVQVAVSSPSAVMEKIAAADLTGDSALPASLPRALILALLGGLLLNLMPCVFPVLSMKALSLVKMSAREQAHAVAHGLFYTCGILASFAGVAGLLIALQQAGNHIGWGFQLQNPVVVLLLAYLLFLIGLNLSGVFEFRAGWLTNAGGSLSRRSGYGGSFFTGMLATLVATPCTAPFMGAAMGYALTQGTITVIVIALALGLGLALPYLLLTTIPSLRHALPKPGPWMETFRQFLSFPMYASAAWLVWVYGQQVDGIYGTLLAPLGMILLAMGLWMWGKAPHRYLLRVFTRGLSITSFILALLIAVGSMTRLPPVVEGGGVLDRNSGFSSDHAGIWSPFTKADLEAALKGNDPVFVNMTASWCITCKVNEQIALAPESTQALFHKYKILYLIGDWTNQNPEITDFLASYGRNGVPLYIYFGGRDPTTGERPDPVVMPQLLTPGVIEDVIVYN